MDKRSNGGHCVGDAEIAELMRTLLAEGSLEIMCESRLFFLSFFLFFFFSFALVRFLRGLRSAGRNTAGIRNSLNDTRYFVMLDYT